MNKKERNHIMNMNRGMKQKISMLLIACLLFTGYQGMTLPGRAAQEDEQNNAISVSGTEVKVQLLGEDLRRAAKEAIEKGERVNDKVFKGYSKDADLEKEYEAVFSPEKEVYEIPLDSISAGLSENLAEEEADLEVFVERDAQDLDNLVRKESKESLLLYDGNSRISELFPKSEETAVKKEEAEKKASEELASDSNLPRSTELTGSELITFLYKNKSDHRITFQLSVDSNKYPKVVVSPKEQLFKELLAKLKKEEKNRALESKKNTENKAVESTEVKNTAAKESEESKAATETVATKAQKESTSVKESTSAAQESSSAAASEVRLVSEESKQETKVETAAAETEEKAQTATESKETAASETVKETAGQKDTEKRAEEKLGNGFLAEVVAHYDEFLAEFQSARFTQYSLNELGRKSQNAEIENFATVEVFYDKDAFDEDVVLEAKRLVKPEEEGQKEGEKLTEEQVKAMKDQAIYDDSDALDIRFVSKADRMKEVEPKVPVSVRLTFDKEAVPEDASADTVAIHHIVEEKDTGKVKMVETVVRAELEKKAEEQVEARKSAGDVAEQDDSVAEAQTTYRESLAKLEKESATSEQKEEITKEFTVSSFSAYVVTWQCDPTSAYNVRFYYVDKNFKEIGPTVYQRITDPEFQIGNNINGLDQEGYNNHKVFYDAEHKTDISLSPAVMKFDGYTLKAVYPQDQRYAGTPSVGMDNNQVVTKIDTAGFTFTTNGQSYPEQKFTQGCTYFDFYFVYELNQKKNVPHKNDSKPEIKNDKFITDNRDGTYDLTLTGKVKDQNSSPKKLDILFVYDNTAVMATGFGFSGRNKMLKPEDYVELSQRKSKKVKEELKNFMTNLSSQKDYDVRYALVTMDGDRGYGHVDENVAAAYDSNFKESKNYKRNYKNYLSVVNGQEDDNGNRGSRDDINITGEYKGEDGKWLDDATGWLGKSHGFNVRDKENSDTKLVYGFTSNKSEILTKIEGLKETESTYDKNDASLISGENYASAMKNVNALMNTKGSEYEVYPAGSEENPNSKVRTDAEKIVVFIAGGDPKFAYIPDAATDKESDQSRFKDGYDPAGFDRDGFSKPGFNNLKFNRAGFNQDGIGVFDDTRRMNDTEYYRFRCDYKKGWSYGNGYTINFPALNQARAELSKLTNVDAFYSIGVGSKDNWKYLNGFAMGQYYNEDSAKKGTYNSKGEFVWEGNNDPDVNKNRRERALAEDVLYKCFDGSTANNLHEAFQGIYKRVARNQVQNVEISDTLTRFVQPVDTQNPKSTVVGQLVKLKDNGVEVDHEVTDPQEKESLNFKGFDIKVDDDYIENGKKLWRISLKTIPEDFTLPAGYEIRAVAKIIPTVEAFEEIGKTFYNGEYHVAPISKDSHGTENIIIGDARTDLNAIYKEDLNREQSDKLRYASSTGQPGLPTNTEATLSYKVNGKDENKKYNKPIINPGNMVIEKAFLGFDEGEFFKESSGLTILGKEILKTISFRISRENAAGTEELLTTVSPADYLGENEDKILKLPNTNLYIKVSRVFKENRQGTPYEKANGKPNISISIYNTPLNMKYRVKEVESSQGKIFSTGTKGYQFDENAVRCGAETEDLKLMDVRRNYHFFNTYKNVPVPKKEKTITIKKVVEEFGGTALTQEAKSQVFDFYIALYKYDGSSFTAPSFTDYQKINQNWKDEHPGDSRIGGFVGEFDIPMSDGSTIKNHMIKVSLKHGESINLSLGSNMYYKILEKKEKKYEVAKAEVKDHGFWITAPVQKVSVHGNEYTITSAIYNEGKEFTFKNPKITLVPTGLRGDFTPYVLCLCGFTFMAGVYLSIKKKKREEV